MGRWQGQWNDGGEWVRTRCVRVALAFNVAWDVEGGMDGPDQERSDLRLSPGLGLRLAST